MDKTLHERVATLEVQLEGLSSGMEELSLAITGLNAALNKGIGALKLLGFLFMAIPIVTSGILFVATHYRP